MQKARRRSGKSLLPGPLVPQGHRNLYGPGRGGVGALLMLARGGDWSHRWRCAARAKHWAPHSSVPLFPPGLRRSCRGSPWSGARSGPTKHRHHRSHPFPRHAARERPRTGRCCLRRPRGSQLQAPRSSRCSSSPLKRRSLSRRRLRPRRIPQAFPSSPRRPQLVPPTPPTPGPREAQRAPQAPGPTSRTSASSARARHDARDRSLNVSEEED